MSKTQLIQVVNQELYVLGKLVSRHPDFPWLFSITDVYKACEVPLKREAVKYGKDPEVTYASKRPRDWLKRNSSEDAVDAVASRLRRRIRKYGIGCGFGRSKKTEGTAVPSVSNRDLCIKLLRGGSTRGETKSLQGTYVAQDFIVDYAGFLNAKLKASINDTFISVLNGYTEEVTENVQKNERIAKGTPARETNKDVNHRLVEACGMKKVLPMKVQQGINEGVLGMTATKYKLAFDIKEPFNDNLTEDQVDTKNIGIALATARIRNHVKPKLSNTEGKIIGKDSGELANLLMLKALAKQ